MKQPMEYESEEEVTQAQAQMAEAAARLAERNLERVAFFLASLGFGIDWGTGPPVEVPRCLRDPLARALVQQGGFPNLQTAFEALDDELRWEGGG